MNHHQAQPTTQRGQRDGHPEHADDSGHAGHPGHSWMMLACCIPMIAIAIALVVTGVVGVGFIFIALLCTAMMALMHSGMSHGNHDDENGR